MSLIYDKAVNITQEYLGIAAKRFVDRHIKAHLNKDPEELESSDIPELVDWLKISFAVISEERGLVDKYVNKLISEIS